MQSKEESRFETLWATFSENELSRDRRVNHHIEVLKLYLQEGLITQSQYEDKMLVVLNRLEQQNSSKRVLGLLWLTEGRHIGNLFGLLSVDDLRGKLHKPAGDDDTSSGNSGNSGLDGFTNR